MRLLRASCLRHEGFHISCFFSSRMKPIKESFSFATQVELFILQKGVDLPLLSLLNTPSLIPPATKHPGLCSFALLSFPGHFSHVCPFPPGVRLLSKDISVSPPFAQELCSFYSKSEYNTPSSLNVCQTLILATPLQG